jgi:hypothetical protein
MYLVMSASWTQQDFVGCKACKKASYCLVCKIHHPAKIHRPSGARHVQVTWAGFKERHTLSASSRGDQNCHT